MSSTWFYEYCCNSGVHWSENEVNTESNVKSLVGWAVHMGDRSPASRLGGTAVWPSAHSAFVYWVLARWGVPLLRRRGGQWTGARIGPPLGLLNSILWLYWKQAHRGVRSTCPGPGSSTCGLQAEQKNRSLGLKRAGAKPDLSATCLWSGSHPPSLSFLSRKSQAWDGTVVLRDKTPPVLTARNLRAWPRCVRGSTGLGQTRAGGRKSPAAVSSLFRVLENARDLSRRNCRIMAGCENRVHRGDVLHHLDLALPSAQQRWED